MATRSTNRGLLDNLLSQAQQRSIVEAVDGEAQTYLWTGSVSGGKTFASLLAFFAAVPKAPTNGLIVIVGRSLLTIERNILDPMQSVQLFGAMAQAVHHTAGSSTAVILGRVVHLVGASDARSEGRIRGATISLVMVDEATLVPQGFWMMLMSRLRVPGAKCLATTNPDAPRHWLRQDFILKAAEVRMRVFEFRLGDNPAHPPGYEDTLKAQYVGLWRRRYIDGEWCVAEGAIFDMFDPDRHVIHGPLPQLVFHPCVGIDYGTTNAFSAHLLGVQLAEPDKGISARLVLAKEFRHDSRVERTQLTDADYSKRVRQWLAPIQPAPKWIAIDPSAASFKLQMYRDGVSNVVAAKNAVLDSIRLMAALFASDQLVIHESCTGLLDELPGFSWDPKKAERGEDAPIKVDDHGVDSSRYAIATSQTLWQPYIPTMAALAAA